MTIRVRGQGVTGVKGGGARVLGWLRGRGESLVGVWSVLCSADSGGEPCGAFWQQLTFVSSHTS